MNTKLIKIRSIERGLTIKEIALKLDINEQTITNWINGRNLDNISKFIKLLDYLQINIKEIK